MTYPIKRVGVMLVHGIGEQRRCEHLEAQTRNLVEAIKQRPNTHVSVDILCLGDGTVRDGHKLYRE